MSRVSPRVKLGIRRFGYIHVIYQTPDYLRSTRIERIIHLTTNLTSSNNLFYIPKILLSMDFFR